MENEINKIIKKSFPELLNLEFSLEYEDLDDSFAETWETNKTSFVFVLDKSFIDAEEEVIVGLIVHELSHISQDLRLLRFERWVDEFLNKHFKRYSLLDERNADLSAVLRGYGQNLLKFLRFIEREFPDFETEGLSINELEILLNIPSA
jgi:hypothetical protein